MSSIRESSNVLSLFLNICDIEVSILNAGRFVCSLICDIYEACVRGLPEEALYIEVENMKDDTAGSASPKVSGTMSTMEFPLALLNKQKNEAITELKLFNFNYPSRIVHAVVRFGIFLVRPDTDVVNVFEISKIEKV